MKNLFKTMALLGLATAVFSLPASAQTSEQPPARAEDPAYLENPHSEDSYAVDEVANTPRVQKPVQSPQATADNGPVFLEDTKKQVETQQQQQPSPNSLRAPAATEDQLAGRTETSEANRPVGSQLAFFEITPALGSISIHDKSAFSLGTNLSFRLANNTPLYFEPSVMVSFLGGDNDQNATIFHLDAGLRYDWIISESPVVPFVKVALGPSLTSNSGVLVNGDTLGDSYFNLFAGGGLKVLINPSIAARLDAGLTLQETDSGLYALASVALPL